MIVLMSTALVMLWIDRTWIKADLVASQSRIKEYENAATLARAESEKDNKEIIDDNAVIADGANREADRVIEYKVVYKDGKDGCKELSNGINGVIGSISY